MSETKQRPEQLPSFVREIKTGYGNLYITVTELDGKPFEVFATIGKPGDSISAKVEAIGRLTSLALRNGIPVQEVIKQIRDITGDRPLMVGSIMIKSIPDAIGFVLEERYGK
jgi:ribonucleoside-diphosphate reductase alpha chain